MARPRSPLILRAPRPEALLEIPEFRERAVDALIFIVEVANAKRVKEAADGEENNTALENCNGEKK